MNIGSDSACHLRGSGKQYVRYWSSKVFLGGKKVAASVNSRKYFFLTFFHCRLVTMAPADGFVVVVDTKSALLCSAFKCCRLPHTISRLCWLQETFPCSWPHWAGPVLAPNTELGSDPSHPSLAPWNSLPLPAGGKGSPSPSPSPFGNSACGSPSLFDNVLIHFWQKKKKFLFGFFWVFFPWCCFLQKPMCFFFIRIFF